MRMTSPEISANLVRKGEWNGIPYEILEIGGKFIFEYKPGSRAKDIVVVNKYLENGVAGERSYAVGVSSMRKETESVNLMGSSGTVRMATEMGLKSEPVPGVIPESVSSPEIDYGKKPVSSDLG